MRVSTIQLFNSSLNQILKLQSGVAKHQDQIASGKRVNLPSDDPVAAAQILRLAERVNNIEQYTRNGGIASLRLNQQESNIANVNDALQRVRELTVRGKTTTLTNVDRRSIATEVRQRAAEILGLANATNASGEYIYSGSKAEVQAFSKTAGGVVFGGDQTARELQISESRSIAEGFTGHDVFMAIRNGNGTFATDSNPANAGTGRLIPAGVTNQAAYQAHDFRIVFTSATTFDVVDDTLGATVLAGQTFVEDGAISFNGIEVSITGTPQSGDEFNVQASRNQSIFETVDRLIGTLEGAQATPADEARFQAEMDRILGDLDQSMDRLREVRAVIGARQHAIESQQQANDDLGLQLQSVRSTLEDVDIIEAVGRLAAQTNALEAAQGAFVRVQGLSLFNFLR